MPWWRKLLALLGLTEDARVRVRAPGIEVVLTGDPDLVKSVLAAVKAELGRQPNKRRDELARPSTRSPRIVQGKTLNPPQPQSDSQIVLPSELDEEDSPYAIPEHHTVPPTDDSDPATPIDGSAPIRSSPERKKSEDEPEPERTIADAKNPSGPNPAMNPLLIPQLTETTIEQGTRGASRARPPRPPTPTPKD